MYFCDEQYKVASCLLCSCSCNLGFYDKGRLGRGERATSGVVAGENLPFCANKYGAFNMVITRKKKKICAANENACNAGSMKSTCWSHQATILKAHRKIGGVAGRRKGKVFFPPLSLFFFKSVISSLGIIFWPTPSVSSSEMVGEHYSHGKICLLCKL